MVAKARSAPWMMVVSVEHSEKWAIPFFTHAGGIKGKFPEGVSETFSKGVRD